MSVLLETTLGDLVVDLDTSAAPKACLNFIKLCSRKYYNYAPLFNLNRSAAAARDGLAGKIGSYVQSGDPEYPHGDGGRSCWALGGDDSRRYFHPEVDGRRPHVTGTLSMACTPSARFSRSDDVSEVEREEAIRASLLCGSQFFLCLSACPTFDGRHCPIGTVVEGLDVLERILKQPVDDTPAKTPLQDIRILHTIVLDDPYDDPPGLPPRPSLSPRPSSRQLAAIKLSRGRERHTDGQVAGSPEDDGGGDGETDERGEDVRRQREADTSALTLETLGDLPFASIRPPENVLFVCKLNPATRADDLGILFGRFGRVVTTHLCRDARTGDSLGYAFVEYDRKEDAERAYAKMQGCLVDDRRIHVDFSQSVSRYSYDTAARRPPNTRDRLSASARGERERGDRDRRRRGHDDYAGDRDYRARRSEARSGARGDDRRSRRRSDSRSPPGRRRRRDYDDEDRYDADRRQSHRRDERRRENSSERYDDRRRRHYR